MFLSEHFAFALYIMYQLLQKKNYEITKIPKVHQQQLGDKNCQLLHAS